MAAGTTLWMLGDNQGSVRDVVRDSGTPYEHIDYSPFGVQNVTVENTPRESGMCCPSGTRGPTPTPRPATNSTVCVVRSELAGWQSEDPSDDAPGPNRDQHCGNGPTDGTDPSGLQPPLPESRILH